MRKLAELDFHNYIPDKRSFMRTAARAIVWDGPKLAMLFSRKFQEYTFPGGGCEKGESLKLALAREMREETGYQVIADSIRPYGYVMEKRVGRNEGLFMQKSYYFTCRLSEVRLERHPTPKEIDRDDEFMFVDPYVALAHNRIQYEKHGNPWLCRENRVLEIILQEKGMPENHVEG